MFILLLIIVVIVDFTVFCLLIFLVAYLRNLSLDLTIFLPELVFFFLSYRYFFPLAFPPLMQDPLKFLTC